MDSLNRKLLENFQINSSALNTMKSRGNLMAPMPGQAMPNSPGTVTTYNLFKNKNFDMFRNLWAKNW